MLCTKCGKKEASVYYKQNINGKVTEYRVCPDCAAELRKEYNKTTAHSFDPFFGGELNLLGSLLGMPASARLAPAKTCPLCGATYRDFASGGKAGCAKCYDVFRAELSETIAGIHGKREHTGRTPKGFIAHMSREKKIGNLREQLNAAISNEKFEDAAKLRDEIKALEAETDSENR